MTDTSRRGFLRAGAAAASAAALPESIRRALALPAASRTGSLQDVEHVVIFMQENRSFDHYLGHLSGVRGVCDRFPVRRANGSPVWHQPRKADAEKVVLPFRLKVLTSSAECVIDLDHNWYPTHAAIAAGRNDCWPAHKTDMTMGYYVREDIPFHYALADAFTVCDHYFCSTPNQTHPNRMYMMTGMVDPTGSGGGPLLDNNDEVDKRFTKHALPPFTWTTFPERLEQAGITWQVYQQGTEVTDDLNGNFGTNVLANFRQFIDAPEGSSLHARGMSKRTLDQLEADVRADRLPQVSWLLPPAAFSEHPRWAPGYGATYVARVIDALTSNPEVWGKTALFLMYDENDGYFDHMVPPQPPTPVLPGLSTVSTEGEINTYVNPLTSYKFHADQLPYGLGPRVPMIVVSPWTKGGHVCSEVFDHTSLIRFVERRFGVHEPNITPWRRAVCGDLTSAFDFSQHSAKLPPLPDTSGYIAAVQASCALPKPGVPETSVAEDVGTQEPGTRPARPLPYALAVDVEEAGSGVFAFCLVNTGTAAACFYAYREGTDEMPRRYTVDAGRTLADRWTIDAGAPARFTITGPNGFFRMFDLVASGPRLIVEARPDAASGGLRLRLHNADRTALAVRVADLAYGHPVHVQHLAPGGTSEHHRDLRGSASWYDVEITADGHAGFAQRLAGHVETGRTSTTDPAQDKPILV